MADQRIDGNELDNCGDLGGDDKISPKIKVATQPPAKREDPKEERRKRWDQFVNRITKGEPNDLAAFRTELEDRAKAILERDERDWAIYNKLREDGRAAEARKFVFWWDERKQQKKEQEESETNKSESTPVLNDDNK